ncbi:ferritin-like domain-containing protein [archaeon]|nr:ferritin-like domain-containing protein [archaeon]
MELYRCEICGDPYLGEEKPKNCPFCGAHERYLVTQNDFIDSTGVVQDLTETSKENLEAALKLEVGNAEFYVCASRKAETDEMKNLFKALSKVESEHASVLCKALGTKKPPISTDYDECSTKDIDNLKESHIREDRAIHKYAKFLSEATEPRVIEIFSAIIAVESDHLSLSEERM